MISKFDTYITEEEYCLPVLKHCVETKRLLVAASSDELHIETRKT